MSDESDEQDTDTNYSNLPAPLNAQSKRAFNLPFEEDENSYLKPNIRECPEDGKVLPVALPYKDSAHSRYPDGYHLLCPHCRFIFDEYVPHPDSYFME